MSEMDGEIEHGIEQPEEVHVAPEDMPPPPEPMTPEEPNMPIADIVEPPAASGLVKLGDAIDALVEAKNTAIATTTGGQITRTPPNAIDAEKALLGGLLLESSAIEDIVEEGLRPDDFYHTNHGLIYKAIRELFEEAEPIDTLTTINRLQMKGQLEHIGGAGTVAQISALVPTAAHVRAYARLIREKSVLRTLINTATNVVESAFLQNERVEDIVDKAEAAIMAIRESNQRKGVIPMNELVTMAVKRLEQAFENKSAVTGIPTGFADFDKKTAGLQEGDLIIVAARPSMGKTAFTLNMASHIAMREKAGVGFFSLEMSSEQLVQRMIGAEGRIDLSRLRRGQIKNTEWAELARAAGELSEAPVFIDETPSLGIAEMRTKARRMVYDHGVKILMIDYLQLMHGPPGTDNKATEVGEISRGLKSIARELKVPVIALSQLNRAVEQRTDKRPMMSDLRESGAIEQDADMICFLYREEYYLKDKTPEDKIGVAELIIGKHRNGPTGTVELKFLSQLTRFENLTRDYEDYAA